ncbi:threonine--tRNA ligase [Candidatus Dojkabacteria bacterium]|nr:threonine--tRNA ligase [Candidatus Dojkabacteria bacterium]
MDKNYEESELFKMRHSAEHVLMQAMQNIYGKDKIIMAMGPAIEEGFYFDFDSPENFAVSEEDFPKIEEEMRKIIKENQKIERREISISEARELFKDNPYKQEWLDEIEAKGDKMVTIYANIDNDGKEVFVDLCKGPHIGSTGQIGKIKLLSVAGAYWRGDEKNKMLTRIYGTSFKTQKELDEHIIFLEEVKKRDHKKIGKELDLFTFSELVGGGLPLWTPKGTIIREELDKFVWELRKAKGYQKVAIPHITKKDLYIKSGHWKKFANELFKIKTREGHEFAMKPMNCPHHTQIYAHVQRSYRDLPQRYAETTMVYRDEQSGELSGLSRVRCITQDDAHVFCRFDQVKSEFFAIWDIVDEFYSKFGFELKVRLSFHDPKNFGAYLGDSKTWKKAENILEELAKERKVEFEIVEGEAAMYGPKIDFMAKDSLGRQWQVATIQLDMNMPESFDLTCINENAEKERVVMLHAAIMGSIERFTSVMIEHTAGKFPAWLSPEQVVIIPIGEDNHTYADKIEEKLKAEGIRVLNDKRDDMMQSKIRDAQKMQIPYMVIIGKREEQEEKVSIRYRDEQKNVVMKLDEFVDKLEDKIEKRDLILEM